MFDIFITYSGWLLGVIGVLLTLFALYRDRKFKEQVQIDNWSELKTAIQVVAQCQLGLNKYLELHKNDADSGVVARLTRSDAYGQELLTDILRRIHYSVPGLTYEDVSRWHAEGKLDQSQMETLIRIALRPNLPSDVKIEFTKS